MPRRPPEIPEHRNDGAGEHYPQPHDEYMIVVHGCYTLIVDGRRIPLNIGDEYFIARGCRTVAKLLLEPELYMPSAATAQAERETDTLGWSSAYCGVTAPVYSLSSHATSSGARGDTTAISSPVVGCRNSMRCACRK